MKGELSARVRQRGTGARDSDGTGGAATGPAGYTGCRSERAARDRRVAASRPRSGAHGRGVKLSEPGSRVFKFGCGLAALSAS